MSYGQAPFNNFYLPQYGWDPRFVVVTPSNGQVLVYNSVSGRWENENGIPVSVDNTSASYYIPFTKSDSGYLPIYTNTLRYNPSLNQISLNRIYFNEGATNDQRLTWDTSYGLVLSSPTTSAFGGRILLDRVALQGGAGKNGAYFDSIDGLNMSDAPIYGVTTLTIDSTSGADTYELSVIGATGAGQFRINWFNGTTTVNPLSLDANGLLWVGATNQTGVGLKMSDRSNTTFWETYPSGNTLNFDYNAVGATKFRCNNRGQFDILGDLASVNYFDRTNTSNAWAVYSNIDIFRWYFGGADRMALTSTGSLYVDADFYVGEANPATATINMKATTRCQITTSLATMGTLFFDVGNMNLTSGTVSSAVGTIEVSTTKFAYYHTAPLYNGMPFACSKMGELEVNHDTQAGGGSSLWYVPCYWNNGASPIGGIKQVNTTTVSFPTTSDRRLKEQIEDLTEDLVGGIIDTLKPRSYVWKESQEPAIGFIADELQAVMPDCVYGEPDAVNQEGKPEYQTADSASPSMIAILVAEVQFLRKRVLNLENKIIELSKNG